MARSKGTIVSVKVPIKWESMTKRQRTRLSLITSRDTRVIQKYLGVIARHEKQLLVGKKKKRIHAGKLDELTLTATRHRDPAKRRTNVLHDFKSKFRNISQNELQECRDIAIAMWNSYLERGGSPPLKSENNHPKKIPRNIFPGRFQLIHRPDLAIKYWLELRDSLDSARLGRIVHDKLVIPLKFSPFHVSQIRCGKTKSCRIIKDNKRKWWVVFAIEIDITGIARSSSSKKPLAVMGVDLGINKAACTVVLTKNGIRHTKYFYQPKKQEYLERLEKRIASLQKEMKIRENHRNPKDKVTKKLRELNHKRAAVNNEWDRVFVHDIIEYITTLTQQYNLYVAIGNPKGIRGIARKAYSRSRKYRKIMHRWAFSRIIQLLEHGLAQLGWTTGKIGSQFLAVYEGRTSIYCHKCGRKGIRPKQNLFVCHSCGYRANADKNGAANIARRMIRLTPVLRSGHSGLGRWILPHEKKSSPKAARKIRTSKQKSRLPQRSPASSEGESAAVRFVQVDLLSFGDETGLSDKDPAVEKAAKKPSAINCLDSPRSGVLDNSQQRTETMSRERSHVPVKSGNARATLKCSNTKGVSNDNRELGGTQKLQVECEFHSTSSSKTHAP